MRISGGSSNVCSSDLIGIGDPVAEPPIRQIEIQPGITDELLVLPIVAAVGVEAVEFDPAARICAAHFGADIVGERQFGAARDIAVAIAVALDPAERLGVRRNAVGRESLAAERSEEHTSELQSLMRISYAVFCLKKKTRNNTSYIYRL